MFGTQENVEKIVRDMNQPVELKSAKRVNGQAVANKLVNRDVLNPSSSRTTNEKDLLAEHVEKVNQTYAINYYRDLTCSVPVIGKIVILFKKVIRRVLFFLIQPIVDEQNAYNVSLTQTINVLNNIIINQRTMIEQQNCQIQNLKSDIDKEMSDIQTEFREIQNLKNDIDKEMSDIQTEFRGEFNKSNDNIAKLMDDFKVQSIRLQAIKNKIDVEQHQHGNSNITPTSAVETNENSIGQNVYGNIDYFAFENAFRGSQESIRKSQLPYIKYFKNKENVIDIGCGRGEFLELLKEEGITSTGVDLYDEFVLYCKDKGLNAVQDDAVNFLSEQADESLGGIFGAQIVEHLDVGQIEAICSLAYSKLQKGGCVILETPNPRCLAIYMNFFYVDPSHVKPVHPETMRYYLKQAGFSDIEVVYTESSRVDYDLPLLQAQMIDNLDEFNSGIEKVSELLFGSQDYAIIARK